MMEFPWPEWMEWVVTGGATAVGVVALQIISRFQGPEK
jgi:NADPH:quinone reductase-like Zn-dependent oxidoreductase